MSQSPALPADVVVSQERVDASVALLRDSVERFGRVVYSSSLGIEAVVLTDLIYGNNLTIDIFTVDTGRLPESTLDLIARQERKYQRSIKVYFPQAEAVEKYVAVNGINGFYNSLEQRQLCCHIRKVEPFNRAVAGYNAWVTGVRHEQSAERASTQPIETDVRNGIHKVSPLLPWKIDEIWAYVRANRLPYNPLHDSGYPSIGCAPCTRAVEPGQDERSGRWWWESPDSRECGLQPRRPPATVKS